MNGPSVTLSSLGCSTSNSTSKHSFENIKSFHWKSVIYLILFIDRLKYDYSPVWPLLKRAPSISSKYASVNCNGVYVSGTASDKSIGDWCSPLLAIAHSSRIDPQFSGPGIWLKDWNYVKCSNIEKIVPNIFYQHEVIEWQILPVSPSYPHSDVVPKNVVVMH